MDKLGDFGQKIIKWGAHNKRDLVYKNRIFVIYPPTTIRHGRVVPEIIEVKRFLSHIIQIFNFKILPQTPLLSHYSRASTPKISRSLQKSTISRQNDNIRVVINCLLMFQEELKYINSTNKILNATFMVAEKGEPMRS